jgi:hypothetical protein
VPAFQIAEWADHSVEVLLKVYAKSASTGRTQYRGVASRARWLSRHLDWGTSWEQTAENGALRPMTAGHTRSAPCPVSAGEGLIWLVQQLVRLRDSLSNPTEAVVRLVAALGERRGPENMQVSDRAQDAIAAQAGMAGTPKDSPTNNFHFEVHDL